MILWGRAYFGWETFWCLNPQWQSLPNARNKGQAVQDASMSEGKHGPYRVSALYPGIRLTTEEKPQENLPQSGQLKSAWHDLFSQLGGCFTGCFNWPADLHYPQLALQANQINPQSV